MLVQTLIFLITALGGIFALAFLLRFMLQTLRAPARNPISFFLAAVTNFAVIPARRVIPGWWRLDLASLVLAWLTEFLQLWLVLKIRGYELGPAVGVSLVAMAGIALLEVVKLAIYVIMVAVVLQAILSWINPYSQAAPLLTTLTRPFLRPFQKLIPLVGNVDLSPLVVLLICQLLLTVPLIALQGMISHYL